MLEISYGDCFEIDAYPFGIENGTSMMIMISDFEDIDPHELVWFQGSEHPDGTNGWIYISVIGIYSTYYFKIPSILWTVDFHLLQQWMHGSDKSVKWQKNGF